MKGINVLLYIFYFCTIYIVIAALILLGDRLEIQLIMRQTPGIIQIVAPLFLDNVYNSTILLNTEIHLRLYSIFGVMIIHFILKL